MICLFYFSFCFSLSIFIFYHCIHRHYLFAVQNNQNNFCKTFFSFSTICALHRVLYYTVLTVLVLYCTCSTPQHTHKYCTCAYLTAVVRTVHIANVRVANALSRTQPEDEQSKEQSTSSVKYKYIQT